MGCFSVCAYFVLLSWNQISIVSKNKTFEDEISKKILLYIDSLLPQSLTLIDFVRQELGVSRSTAYKKISGESNLTMDELCSLTTKFNLPLHSFMGMEGHALFQIDGIKRRPNHYLDYLDYMQSHFDQLAKYKEVSFIYMSSEVPIFHLMHYPELLSLKLFMWELTNWDTNTLPNDIFSLSLFKQETKKFEQLRSKLLSYYLSYAGAEIWHLKLLNSLIAQIKFITKGMMVDELNTIDVLLLKLEQLFDYLQNCCVNGIKRPQLDDIDSTSEVIIYHNEIVDQSNIIYVTTPQHHMVYSMFDAPNFLNCSDPKVANHIGTWLDKVISHSNKISKEGRLERRQFLMR